MDTIKLLMVGDGTVGKTSLLIKHTTDNFPDANIPTVLDLHSSTTYYKKKPYRIEVWDTAGQEELPHLRSLSYSYTNVALICFAIDDPVSYASVEYLWSKEIRNHCPKAVIILVGTKVDLRDDQATIEKLDKEGKSLKTFEEGTFLAEKIGAKTYVECSALRGVGVKEVFDNGALLYLKKKTLKKKIGKLFKRVF